MRQHKAICAFGGLKVVGAWHDGGGWCDHTGSRMAEDTQAQKFQEERQSDQIKNFSKATYLTVARLLFLGIKKRGPNSQSKNK